MARLRPINDARANYFCLLRSFNGCLDDIKREREKKKHTESLANDLYTQVRDGLVLSVFRLLNADIKLPVNYFMTFQIYANNMLDVWEGEMF